MRSWNKRVWPIVCWGKLKCRTVKLSRISTDRFLCIGSFWRGRQTSNVTAQTLLHHFSHHGLEPLQICLMKEHMNHVQQITRNLVWSFIQWFEELIYLQTGWFYQRRSSHTRDTTAARWFSLFLHQHHSSDCCHQTVDLEIQAPNSQPAPGDWRLLKWNSRAPVHHKPRRRNPRSSCNSSSRNQIFFQLFLFWVQKHYFGRGVPFLSSTNNCLTRMCAYSSRPQQTEHQPPLHYVALLLETWWWQHSTHEPHRARRRCSEGWQELAANLPSLW